MTTPSSVLAIVGLLALTSQAEAHAHLKTSMPPANGTVATSPTELTLGFSEALNLRFSGVAVTGPAKQAIATSAASLKPGDDMVLVVPLPTPLTAGSYTVSWHALATDGHKTTGSYSFTVKP